MFSANRLPAKCVFRPKNGPVPSQPVKNTPLRYIEAEITPPRYKAGLPPPCLQVMSMIDIPLLFPVPATRWS